MWNAIRILVKVLGFPFTDSVGAEGVPLLRMSSSEVVGGGRISEICRLLSCMTNVVRVKAERIRNHT
jgi:hypothetical protein